MLAYKKQLTETKDWVARVLRQIKPNCLLLSRTEKSLFLQSCNDEVPRIENRPVWAQALSISEGMDAALPPPGLLGRCKKEKFPVSIRAEKLR